MFFKNISEKQTGPLVRRTRMTNKNGFFLAALLIANPFMLLLFQNCSTFPQDRSYASLPDETSGKNFPPEKRLVEVSFSLNRNLKVK